MKPGYIVVDIRVTDPAKFERYRALATEAVAAHGGEFLVRGGRSETLEGSWEPSRLVVVRFPSFEQARVFNESFEYGRARAERAGATEFFDMVLVEGG